MRRSLTMLAAAFALVASAQGGIGDTEAQIRARYGEAIGVLPARAGDASLTKCYSTGGFIISVTYVKGHSAREILTKGNKSKITETEIQTALKANAGGSAWNAEQLADPRTAGVQEWRTNNQESRVAIYDSQTRALFITTQQFIDLTKATKPQVAAKGSATGLSAFGTVGTVGTVRATGGRSTLNMKLFDQSAVLRSQQSQPRPSASPGGN
jgi:hypothetical protein